MSLFGDFADDPPSTSAHQRGNPSKSSLFDDDRPSGAGSGPGNRNSASLFAEEDSPWGMPTPKKAGRAQLVKQLLANVPVPDVYVDTFDGLVADGDKQGNGVSPAGVKKVLDAAGLDEDVKSRILGLVLPTGEQSAVDHGVGRHEFNVLLALVAVAQEGEELGLDAVDDRKRSMNTTTAQAAHT
jgi:sorting nexin-8